MCTFKAYLLESTLLEIQNPALTSRKHHLKLSGKSTIGDLQNSLCMLDRLMCIFKAYMLQRTLLEIQYPALTSRKHLLKVSSHSTKGDFQNSQCTLYILMCTFKVYMIQSQGTSEHTRGGPIFFQSSHYMSLEHSSFLSYSSILQGFRSRVCAYQTQLCAHLKPVCMHSCTPRFSMTFLSILKQVQVISCDSRQMRKNTQIADRPTNRQTKKQTD